VIVKKTSTGFEKLNPNIEHRHRRLALSISGRSLSRCTHHMGVKFQIQKLGRVYWLQYIGSPHSKKE
jgi:hypothetical protein